MRVINGVRPSGFQRQALLFAQVCSIIFALSFIASWAAYYFIGEGSLVDMLGWLAAVSFFGTILSSMVFTVAGTIERRRAKRGRL